MVVSGKVKKAAFYCRMNHSNHDCTQFLEKIQKVLDGRYGAGNWKMTLFFEVESGTNPNRKKFLQLKSEIQAGKWDAVATMKADTIARDWKQFMEFMEICEENSVEVICTRGLEDAEPIYKRIQQFVRDYFEGSDCP